MVGRLVIAAATLLMLGCSSPVPPTPSPQTTSWLDGLGDDSLVLQMRRETGAPLQGMTYWPVPDFTLYASGEAIYTTAFAPWTTSLSHASLTDEQVLSLVADALGQGGLSTARATYDDVSFESTTYFFVFDGDRVREITVTGLGFNDAEAASSVDRAKFNWLADRLANFENDVAAGKAHGLGDYQPAQYRVWLFEPNERTSANAPWPWPDLTIDDFQTLQNTLGPSRLMSPAQAQAVLDLGIEFNLVVPASDGHDYQVTVVPMLPLDYHITP
jgi:hypothetical protein